MNKARPHQDTEGDAPHPEGPEEMARAGERYLKSLDGMLEGCQLISFDWRYLYVNDAVARQARKTREELLGRTMMEVFPGIDTTPMFTSLRRCMDERAPSQMENEFTYPDGSVGWFTLSIQPAPDGVLIVSIDLTARKQAEMNLQRQLARLDSLRTIDLAILGATELGLTLSVVLQNVTQQLEVDAALVLLLNPHTQTLEYAAGIGFRTTALQHTRLPLGQSYSGRAALERRLVHVPDLRGRQTDFLRSPQFAAEGFIPYYGLPLIAKGQVKGVLEIFHRAPLDPDREWLDFMEALAGQTAIAIEGAQLFEGLQRSNLELTMAYDTTLEGWSAALDLRDKETEGHSKRVTEKTIELARALDVSETDLVHVRRGALLHDIGKMGVPDAILLKPSELTDEEWVVMRRHPTYAFELLSPIAFLRPALDIPFAHHEKWDGSGYPRGLKGEEIPLAARAFAVVDVWDALTSDRPYRKAWSPQKSREHIRDQAGKHFDPRVVEAFLRMDVSKVR